MGRAAPACIYVCAHMAPLQIPVQRAHTMWGKSREKKAARMYHTRNFGTGHVEPDEYYLSRIGVRGRKRWLLLSSVLLGYLLVIGHFVVSLICSLCNKPICAIQLLIWLYLHPLYLHTAQAICYS